MATMTTTTTKTKTVVAVAVASVQVGNVEKNSTNQRQIKTKDAYVNTHTQAQRGSGRDVLALLWENTTKTRPSRALVAR